MKCFIWTILLTLLLLNCFTLFPSLEVLRFSHLQTSKFSKSNNFNPHQAGVSESLIRRGGQICPPLVYGYRRVFSLFFLNRDLVLDVKGQNPKAQPSTFKIEALRIFWKINIFGENPKKLKIRYLEIRCLIQKRSARDPQWSDRTNFFR